VARKMIITILVIMFNLFYRQRNYEKMNEIINLLEYLNSFFLLNSDDMSRYISRLIKEFDKKFRPHFYVFKEMQFTVNKFMRDDILIQRLYRERV